jgi:hypothetical protein
MGGYTLCDYTILPAVRRNLTRCAGCVLSFAMLLMATTCWAATYRWVDEHGKVHYGDSIPAQYAGSAHEELDAQGRVIRRVEPFPATEAERHKRALEAAQKAAAALAEAERRHHDTALLATYESVKEIDQARDRALAQEEALLRSLQVMRKQSQSEAEAAQIDAMILQRQKNMDEIRVRYEADKARYRELTGEQ